MSGRLVGQAFYVPVDPSSKLVLLALADHANDEGLGVWPGNERLAVKVGLSIRQVQRCLGHLESHGLIRRVKHRLGGRGKAVEWGINAAAARAWSDFFSDAVDNYRERVTPTSSFYVKGDICDTKGCHLERERVTPMSPQPSEPTEPVFEFLLKEKQPEESWADLARRRAGLKP